MKNWTRLALLVLSASPLHSGCACNDEGCPATVTIFVDDLLSVTQLELATPTGWVSCPSEAGSCVIESLDDGRTKYVFLIAPTQSVELRARDSGGNLVFADELTLTINKIKNDPDACERDCKEGIGRLQELPPTALLLLQPNKK